jgi:hypothetical protein|nr:MAG TPA: Protein of unknown function (DUF669) [Caudoviricetes sp.]
MADNVNSNIVIDLSNYKDSGNVRIPEGRYRAIVDDVDLDKSRAGNTMIKVWMRVLGGEHAGAVILDRLTLTDKAMFRVVGFMQGIGIKTPKKKLQINLKTFLKRQADIEVVDGEPYNGRIKSEIAQYIRVAQPKAEESSEDDLDALEAAAEDESPAKPSSDAKKAEAAAIVQDVNTEDTEPENPWDAGDDSDSVDVDDLSIDDLDL